MEDLMVPKEFLDRFIDSLPNVNGFKGSSFLKTFTYKDGKFELEFYVIKDTYENIRWHYSPFDVKKV